MLVLHAVLRPLVRRKLRNLLVVVVSLVLVLFLNMYANTISQHHQTLDELHANIEVTAYITGMGGGIDGLQIEAKVINGLENSGFSWVDAKIMAWNFRSFHAYCRRVGLHSLAGFIYGLIWSHGKTLLAS